MNTITITIIIIDHPFILRGPIHCICIYTFDLMKVYLWENIMFTWYQTRFLNPVRTPSPLLYLFRFSSIPSALASVFSLFSSIMTG